MSNTDHTGELKQARLADPARAAEAKRAAKKGMPAPGKYVILARRRLPGLQGAADWTPAEWVLPGNPASTFHYRDEAVKVMDHLEREHPHVSGGFFELLLKIERRAGDDQGPAPLEAPPPPPPPLPDVPLDTLGEKGAPTLAELVRAATQG